jgi:hypothetical protein
MGGRAGAAGPRAAFMGQAAGMGEDARLRARSPGTEFFRKGGRMRGLVKGKRWLLLTRRVNPTPGKRQELTQLFALNRKVFNAYRREWCPASAPLRGGRDAANAHVAP